MRTLQFFIDGAWVDPAGPIRRLPVVDPATEEPFAEIALGDAADVDRAVRAARRAFETFSLVSREERLDLLRRILVVYRRRINEMGEAISREMGAPLPFAVSNQAGSGAAHLQTMIRTLEHFAFEELRGSTLVTREPIGVVAMITPWNWPMNQIVCKVAPALAAGCTMVLKPSEIAPMSALLFAEILQEAGVPAGVFNLVNGDGPTVGEALARHEGVDMVSFTGSTRAGVAVAKAAADTIKRVHQELGGKSANILLPDVDLTEAVTRGVAECFGNTGQSCNAPTRMFVPAEREDEAAAIAARAAARFRVGAAPGEGPVLGPVVSEAQFGKIQDLIESGLREGAELVAGGPGRPDGLNRGWFVRPTVFAKVSPEMRIAREEIFGPVLSIVSYENEDEAVRLANDTVYGLAAYVQSADLDRARALSRRLRAGNVYLNDPAWDTGAPFGGYKQSGNGREYAEFGLAEFLEIKGIVGWGAAP
ncbi:aldehyde dehydrogenase family protein [Aureimonas jatrophae]|uniref:aldehyde dehydrogenase (NAD(+)) n=1 Tax=Aureimonas jatrophae TaxID=1166073 RepID=A0A1H0L7Y3_9HYPH|nr:aldehyde dehydrogenase family protein [Aureimonas jatrophae]MBB3952439.1 aldehyde dehydrogenase (NAD+) [Aureimonas jatrophae]SDO64103.1 aldehyde dehydrogenase (NAD+) [Aureimonas jatrophae]